MVTPVKLARLNPGTLLAGANDLAARIGRDRPIHGIVVRRLDESATPQVGRGIRSLDQLAPTPERQLAKLITAAGANVTTVDGVAVDDRDKDHQLAGRSP